MVEWFALWCLGNLVIPALPVFLLWGFQALLGRKLTLATVVQDGILYFYVVSLSAILLMDVWKVRSGHGPVEDSAVTGPAFMVCVVVLIVASGAYLVTALAHAGRKDKDGDVFDLELLGRRSWQFALAAAILAGAFRLSTGIY